MRRRIYGGCKLLDVLPSWTSVDVCLRPSLLLSTSSYLLQAYSDMMARTEKPLAMLEAALDAARDRPRASASIAVAASVGAVIVFFTTSKKVCATLRYVRAHTVYGYTKFEDDKVSEPWCINSTILPAAFVLHSENLVASGYRYFRDTKHYRHAATRAACCRPSVMGRTTNPYLALHTCSTTPSRCSKRTT